MSKKLCTYPDTHSWKNVRALWTISVTFFKFANFLRNLKAYQGWSEGKGTIFFVGMPTRKWYPYLNDTPWAFRRLYKAR